MSDVKNNVIVNSLVEAQEAASLINFTVRRLEQRINDSICDADEYRRVIIKLEDRIRRLEEAGDRMDLYADPHDSDKWNEAMGRLNE